MQPVATATSLERQGAGGNEAGGRAGPCCTKHSRSGVGREVIRGEPRGALPVEPLEARDGWKTCLKG